MLGDGADVLRVLRRLEVHQLAVEAMAHRADGLIEPGAAPGVAAGNRGGAVDVAVHVDLAAAEEYGQLLHGAVRHHLFGEVVGLVHDDLVDPLDRHSFHAAHALDAGVVRALAVGAVLALVVPAVAFLAAPGAGALLLAGGRIGRMRFLRRILFQHRVPLVVQLAASGHVPDVGEVVGMALDLITRLLRECRVRGCQTRHQQECPKPYRGQHGRHERRRWPP